MNENDFTPTTRKAAATLAAVFGLFGVFVVPILVRATFNDLVGKLIRLMVEDPHFEKAPMMLTIWFTGMLGVSTVASVTLLVSVYPL